MPGLATSILLLITFVAIRIIVEFTAVRMEVEWYKIHLMDLILYPNTSRVSIGVKDRLKEGAILTDAILDSLEEESWKTADSFNREIFGRHTGRRLRKIHDKVVQQRYFRIAIGAIYTRRDIITTADTLEEEFFSRP